MQGVHSASHTCVPWLSGSWNGPVACDPLSPFIKFALHPIGGFCSVSTELPPSHIRSEHVTAAVQQNGRRPRFGETIHCLAVEPYQVFLHVAIVDNNMIEEVPYETVVLGRLRPGYRVLQLRNRRGTRIEFCFLFVKISFGREDHKWATGDDLRIQNRRLRDALREAQLDHAKETAEC